MAVAAIDAVAGDMALVAELNRLIACDVRLGHPRGAIDLVEQAEQRDDREYGAKILTRAMVLVLRWKI